METTGKNGQRKMAKAQEITCKCGCGRKKLVRVADIKRGWGLFYSKSCKASYQESRTGQYIKYMNKKRKSFGNHDIYQEDGIHPIGYGHIFESGDGDMGKNN